MKTIVYQSGNVPFQVCKEVSDLLVDAFSERRNQGINFKRGIYSAQDVDNELNSRGI